MNRPPIEQTLCAIESLVEEGLEISDCVVLDPAVISWTKAVAVVLELRQKLLEARACVAETRVALPPGPLVSEAVRVIRDELRREPAAG